MCSLFLPGQLARLLPRRNSRLQSSLQLANVSRKQARHRVIALPHLPTSTLGRISLVELAGWASSARNLAGAVTRFAGLWRKADRAVGTQPLLLPRIEPLFARQPRLYRHTTVFPFSVCRVLDCYRSPSEVTRCKIQMRRPLPSKRFDIMQSAAEFHPHGTSHAPRPPPLPLIKTHAGQGLDRQPDRSPKWVKENIPLFSLTYLTPYLFPGLPWLHVSPARQKLGSDRFSYVCG